MTDRPGDARVVSPQIGVWTRLGRVWQYRELLVGMVRRELKVKYKNSFLGFAWSLVNPLMYLLVFYVAFQLILGAGIPNFAIFLLSGLLVWNLFSQGLAAATGSIVGNAGIVNKVYFPREILPLAAIGAALVHFFLQSLVLAVVLVVVRWDVAWSYMPLVPVALVVLVVLTAGLGLFLSSVNVYFRDTEHILELALLAWFWMTPIVYAFQFIGSRGGAKVKLFMCNPLTPVVLVFQRAIYAIVSVDVVETVDNTKGPQAVERLTRVNELLPSWSVGGYALYLSATAALAVVMLFVGLYTFGRLEANFAEEL